MASIGKEVNNCKLEVKLIPPSLRTTTHGGRTYLMGIDTKLETNINCENTKSEIIIDLEEQARKINSQSRTKKPKILIENKKIEQK